ncbi:TPA: SpoIIE family protein phosphatase [Candidatus Woesearchaeota archaeon]|nr:SpoIIE family protein phosphatase [Candidatus Woesearchaeota archaeon]HIH31733.1 SpoIIE family protein phosphatase [Candidatus Woesearchaeota archaeon]HIH54703.1 SpoIIE family protein phosphatase [Candidatus Woesearchaeota archaeon]HIJ13996.1 SpoIIE family protein phosphatase [Candidatus Woesearchaeota archaeon]
MGKAINISEIRNFNCQRSLKESPFVFETLHVKGAVFYLTKDGVLNGDAFAIKSNNLLTVSLVEDMQGHGDPARRKLNNYISDLEKITDSASNDKHYILDVLRLDEKAGYAQDYLALSLVVLKNNGELECLNGGENIIIIRKNRDIFPLGPESNCGKIGLLDLIHGSKNKYSSIVPYRDKLYGGDRIFLCSDGVIDLATEIDLSEQVKNNIINELKSNSSLENTIKNINVNNFEALRKFDKIMPVDDYTIVCLELKQQHSTNL